MSESKRSPPTHRARRWWRCGAICLLVAAGLFYFTGGATWLLHRRMAAALAVRHYESAEDTLGWIRTLHCATGETSFWEARLRRKQLRIPEVGPLLDAAYKAGFDRRRLQREALLLRAQTGKLAGITGELDNLVGDPGDDGPEICEAYVNGALISGDTPVALTIINAWKAEFPDDAQPHYAYGRLLEYRTQIDNAEREFRAAIAKDARHWPARYSLGRLLMDRNRIEEALEQFDAAAHMRDNAAPWYQRAKCLRALSRSDEAHAVLSELVARPADAVARSFARVSEPQRGLPIQLELGTLEVSRQNPDAALHWLNMVLDDDPRNLEALTARASALRAVGKADEADRDLAQVRAARIALNELDKLVDLVEREPDQPHVADRCRIGEIFLRHENARKAEFWLHEALHRDPEYRPAHALLAEYYANLAKREPAYAKLAEEHRQAAEVAAPADALPERSTQDAP